MSKAISKPHGFVLLFIVLVQTGCSAHAGDEESPLNETTSYIAIKEFVALQNNEELKSILIDFSEIFSETDSILIAAETENHYEIHVTHPSFTDPSGISLLGGSEQYYLDKRTGKHRMGWHEHPMRDPTK